MPAYYNENDPKTAAWLRELIAAGLIADGDVDERSITEVIPADVQGYTQAHFFAGIGGWSYSLRLAGWPDERAVWTGSCPCQPFSNAGKGAGADDSRDLWPAWFKLLRECAPLVVFGEQVASADGLGWLDRVHADLEGEGYAVWAVDCCAASVGAFHVRQRLYFVADASSDECCSGRRYQAVEGRPEHERASVESPGLRDGGELGHTSGKRLPERECIGRFQQKAVEPPTRQAVERGSDVSGMAESDESLASNRALQRSGRLVQSAEDASPGFWASADWIACFDGKSRPVEPGTFPLAHGVSNRVVKLRGYGNAIVPQVAQAFIESYMQASSCNGETLVQMKCRA